MSRAAKAASNVTRRATRSSTGVAKSPKDKKQADETPIKQEKTTTRKRASSFNGSPAPTKKRVKKEVKDEEAETGLTSPPPSDEPSTPKSKSAKAKKPAPASLKDKKLKSYAQFANTSPFPDFKHPTPEECKLAHRILSSLHGAKVRPKEVIARNDRAGCGDSPSVLDALVRTILSQNTSDVNSTRAKLSMDKAYGGSNEWEAIVAGGQSKLQEAIKCGGLSVVKSRVIISILNQVYEKYGKYSLDHLHTASSEVAMTEMLSFQGVGPKTASCVLLFCLQRESFAVDTHVWRITGLLGWRPMSASRDETHQHLDVMIPDEDKYGLHILLVTHGKRCEECKAGGKRIGKCELRKAFRQGKIKGEAGEDVKEEEIEQVKKEEN
jgi:endonuclease III